MTCECFCCDNGPIDVRPVTSCDCDPKRCPRCGDCLKHCACPPWCEGMPAGVKP